MKINLPGLAQEKLPSGNYRYRVRVESNSSKKIRLNATPEDKNFMEHYHAARAGISLPPDPASPADVYVRGSVAWLTTKYIMHLETQVNAGIASELTLRQRRGLLR